MKKLRCTKNKEYLLEKMKDLTQELEMLNTSLKEQLKIKKEMETTP